MKRINVAGVCDPGGRAHRARLQQQAFSLIELLLVVAIIGGLAVVATTSLTGFQNGLAITDAAERVAGVMREASQQASVCNAVTLVRIYKTTEPAGVSSSEEFRAIQVVLKGADGTERALSRPVWLGKRVIIVRGADSSPMLELATSGTGKLNGATVEYRQIAFYPNRRTNLAPGDWEKAFLTIRREEGENFAVVTLEPGNGKVRVLRP